MLRRTTRADCQSSKSGSGSEPVSAMAYPVTVYFSSFLSILSLPLSILPNTYKGPRWTVRKTGRCSYGNGRSQRRIAPNSRHSLGLASIDGSDRRTSFVLSATGGSGTIWTMSERTAASGPPVGWPKNLMAGSPIALCGLGHLSSAAQRASWAVWRGDAKPHLRTKHRFRLDCVASPNNIDIREILNG